jgi:hypothetical protein
MTTKAAANAVPKRSPGRPALPADQRMTLINAKFGPADHANLAEARRLFGSPSDSAAIRDALASAVRALAKAR